jgi:hypothetical protein
MNFFVEAFQFLTTLGLLPPFVIFLVFREIYFRIVGENPIDPIVWEKDPIEEMWMKIKRYFKICSLWTLSALVIDPLTRNNLFMITMLQLYVIDEFPPLLVEFLFELLFYWFAVRRSIGVETLFDHYQLNHQSNGNERSSNYQTFAFAFFTRALQDPGVSHMYNKLWRCRGLSKKQKEFQDNIANLILELSVEEFCRPLPENVSREDRRRSSNNIKLLAVLLKRENSGAEKKRNTARSLLTQHLQSGDKQSVEKLLQAILDNEPYYDCGQLSSAQEQLLLSWFKGPAQSRNTTYEGDSDVGYETDDETIKRRSLKVKLSKLYVRNDYSFGLVGFIKRIWNRLNDYRKNLKTPLKTKKTLNTEAVLPVEPHIQPKSDVISLEPQDTVNEVTKETLNSTIPDPPIAPFEIFNVISTNDLSATSDDKDAGDNLPKLELKSKIQIRKPKMARHRTETSKRPEELQVIPSAGMKPAAPAVAAAVKSSGDCAPKPFRAKPAPVSTYKPPSTKLNKDQPDRRAIKKHRSKPKVIAKPTKKDEPRQFRPRHTPPSTYKPTLYPYMVNSRSKRS